MTSMVCDDSCALGILAAEVGMRLKLRFDSLKETKLRNPATFDDQCHPASIGSLAAFMRPALRSFANPFRVIAAQRLRNKRAPHTHNFYK